MNLVESLCGHEDPVVAWRARRLLAREVEGSPAMRRLRRRIPTTAMARQLLKGLEMERFNPYRKWQGPHWTLYSLAEIGFPEGERDLLPLRERVLDWMLAPAFLQPPMTVMDPERPRRCASMEGNAIWSQLVLGIVDEERSPQLVNRLITFQWPDGGWNCDKRAAVRTSSVQETLVPLRALGLWARVRGDREAKRAAKAASEFLLQRRLLWRKRDGALINPGWGGPVDAVQYPFRFYDVLSALLVMTELGLARDPRCRDALDLLERKRLPDGTFGVEWTNARRADRIVTRGTYADWGPLRKKTGNALVTIDALFVLLSAGRRV